MSASLVKYGRSAFVGLFTGEENSFAHGEAVVVLTPRGAEIGTFLCSAREQFDDHLKTSGGKLLRSADHTDLQTAELCELRTEELLRAVECRIAASGLPIMVIDAEWLLENSGAILHIVAWSECDADGLFMELSHQFGVKVSALIPTQVAQAEAETAGCGKPDCGSTSGGCSGCGTSGEASGCSTGSCSRGSVKSAEELSRYFAQLRKQMESRRTPLA